jgi:TRAP-type C4-dicarboxylate transport system substrate-binding protein
VRGKLRARGQVNFSPIEIVPTDMDAKYTMVARNNTGLLTSASVAAGLACAAPALAAEQWDMPTAYPAANFQTVNAQEFATCVATGTNNEITITIHPNGSLFKAADIKRAVQTGQAVIGERLLSAHENESAVYGTDSIPFIATTYDASVKMYSAARPELEKLLDSQGLKLVYSVPWPPQGLYFKTPVNAVADMKGIRVRSYNKATAKIAELTGMAPIQIEAAETSQAMSAGVIESLITSAVTGVDVKAWENLKYFYTVDAWMPRNHVIINKAKFEGLDAAKQKAITDCATTAEAAGLQKSQDAKAAALKALADNGVQVLPPSEGLAKELAAIGATMAAEWQTRAGDAGKTIMDAFKK